MHPKQRVILSLFEDQPMESAAPPEAKTGAAMQSYLASVSGNRFIHGPELLLMAQEKAGQHRIKMAAPALADDARALFVRNGLFIHAL